MGLFFLIFCVIYIVGLVVLLCISILCWYGVRCCFIRGYLECICFVERECFVDVKFVCGSDGRNYFNECVMIVRVCLMRKDVIVVYSGICGMRILD